MRVAMGERWVGAARDVLGWACSVALVCVAGTPYVDAQERVPADAAQQNKTRPASATSEVVAS